MAERTCRICGEPVTDTTFHLEGRKQRCCSMTCLRIHWRDKERRKVQRRGTAKSMTPTSCPYCGSPTSPVAGRGKPRIYCDDCREKALAPWQPHEATCAACRRIFMMRKRTQRFCSEACRPRKYGAGPRPADRQLNLQERRRLVATVRASQPNCHLCGYLIDLTLDKQRHPLGSCVDEVVPRSQGGSALDPANTRHCHRLCNTSRGTKPITPEVRARCRSLVESAMTRTAVMTTREW